MPASLNSSLIERLWADGDSRGLLDSENQVPRDKAALILLIPRKTDISTALEGGIRASDLDTEDRRRLASHGPRAVIADNHGSIGHRVERLDNGGETLGDSHGDANQIRVWSQLVRVMYPRFCSLKWDK